MLWFSGVLGPLVDGVLCRVADGGDCKSSMSTSGRSGVLVAEVAAPTGRHGVTGANAGWDVGGPLL